MLVLSRKPGESVQIGPDIRVQIMSTANGRVRLGFDAPRQVRILRSELKTLVDPAGLVTNCQS